MLTRVGTVVAAATEAALGLRVTSPPSLLPFPVSHHSTHSQLPLTFQGPRVVVSSALEAARGTAPPPALICPLHSLGELGRAIPLLEVAQWGSWRACAARWTCSEASSLERALFPFST